MKLRLLKKGNLKLSSSQGIWTLPRSTCLGAGICKKYCYAKKMENFPNVKESRERKLKESKNTWFGVQMLREIIERRIEIVRIHESGDFYSQEYLDKWIAIAKALSEVRFYAFTKAFPLDFSHVPENLVIIQSYGSRFDSKINPQKNTSRVIETEGEAKKGEYVCPYGKMWFTKCGESCSYCFSKFPKVKHVVFKKH